MCPPNTTSDPERDKIVHQAERYKAQNQLLIQAYEKIHKTLDELKKTEDLLVESEKLASLGELVATISHEVKAPLGAISAANNIINEFILAIPTESFEIARLLSESEYKAAMTVMSLPTEDNTSINSEISIEKLKERLLELGFYDIDEDLISLLPKLSRLKIEDIYKLSPILKSARAKEIMEYLNSYCMLKTSIWITRKSVDRAVKLIDELKNYSYRNTSGEIEISLPRSISNILTIYQSKLNGMEIVRDFDDVKITGDPDRLSQVWTNLITNGAQASKFKGKIEVSIKEDHEKKWVSIKDQAGGIPKELQDKIFQPFFTTKEKGKGTGLGLSIVKRIVEEHKGNIRFEVEDGVGTNAIVEFKKKKHENTI